MIDRKGKASICWNCDVEDCNWIRKGEEVEGWEVKKYHHNLNTKYSYYTTRVLKCPNYVKHIRKEGKVISDRIWKQMDYFYFNKGYLFDILEINQNGYNAIKRDLMINDLDDFFNLKVVVTDIDDFELSFIDKKKLM